MNKPNVFTTLSQCQFLRSRLCVSMQRYEILSKSQHDETINKHQEDILYSLKLAYAKKAHDLITKATITNPNEPSIDHPEEIFRVYDYVDECYRVEMKVRCNRDGNYLHILRVYKK